MRAYYYVLSSLPMLFFDRPAPMSKEEFLYIVQGQVEENDIRLLEQAKLVPTEDVCTGNAVLDSWLNWETELRNELIRQRNAPFQTEGQNHIREADTVAGQSGRALV